MWILSGRMCALKRSGNTMIVSKAIEPQINARLAEGEIIVRFGVRGMRATRVAGRILGQNSGFESLSASFYRD